MSMYEQIAHYYDLTHADLTADIDWVVALGRRANGPVLELGCGSGRLLLPLARAGIRVTGVDNSPAMLARARAVLAAVPGAQVSLVQQDMTTLSLADNGRFSLAILPYNTAMHLDSESVAQVLRRVRGMMAANGRLAIDVINPVAVSLTPDDRTLALERVVPDPANDEIVVQLSSSWLDDERQQLHITWIYDASPAAGGAVRRTVAQGVYHYRFPHQWDLLLQEAGWRLETLAGSYDGEAFSEESERLLITAVLD